MCSTCSDSECLLIGPLPKTVVDFWRLVWQEKPPSIVMVTNIKEGNKIKCQQYWPETGNKSFGPFQITITDQQVFADYTIRTFQVTVSYIYPPELPFHFTSRVNISLYMHY